MEKTDTRDSGQSLSRREFLRTGGMALAGAALAPSILTASAVAAEERSLEKSSKKIRIGVVGGGFGTSFHWDEHPNCVVEAVSDLIDWKRENLKKVYKCDKSYNSLEELIKDKNIDAVAVFTGAPDHVRHAVMCMKEGKHVISAVPAATTMEDAEELLQTVRKTGLTYMMAETSYWQQFMISARKFWEQKQFGDIYYSESEYHHGGMEYSLWFDADKKPTWRWGLPPMLYPTHNLAFIVGLTGERLTEVMCTGWKDDDPIIKGNTYKNPFWNETAFFTTNKGNSHRASVYWRGAFRGTVGARWYGNKMSFFSANPNGLGPVIARHDVTNASKDDAGFYVQEAALEQYAQVEWWKTDMLPQSMRHNSHHEGSHTFISHEFIDALVNGRRPAIDVYEALAMTVPGIVAHQSALQGGKPMKIPTFKG